MCCTEALPIYLSRIQINLLVKNGLKFVKSSLSQVSTRLSKGIEARCEHHGAGSVFVDKVDKVPLSPMSDDGYEPQADLTQEALLASDRDPESGTLPQVSSWESLRRESANRARKNSQAGSNVDEQSSDRPSSSGYGRTGSIWSQADTEYSHPMGRWEKEGEFLIPLECYQRMPRWKKCCVLFSVLFILFLTVMIPVTFAVIVPGIIDQAVGQSTTVLIRAVRTPPTLM